MEKDWNFLYLNTFRSGNEKNIEETVKSKIGDIIGSVCDSAESFGLEKLGASGI